MYVVDLSRSRLFLEYSFTGRRAGSKLLGYKNKLSRVGGDQELVRLSPPLRKRKVSKQAYVPSSQRIVFLDLLSG